MIKLEYHQEPLQGGTMQNNSEAAEIVAHSCQEIVAQIAECIRGVASQNGSDPRQLFTLACDQAYPLLEDSGHCNEWGILIEATGIVAQQALEQAGFSCPIP